MGIRDESESNKDSAYNNIYVNYFCDDVIVSRAAC